MVPVFYLDVHEHKQVVIDDRGMALPDVNRAIFEAYEGIRSIAAEGVRNGKLDLNLKVEVLDSRRQHVIIIPLKDAVEI